jgi:hypothetical protein
VTVCSRFFNNSSHPSLTVLRLSISGFFIKETKTYTSYILHPPTIFAFRNPIRPVKGGGDGGVGCPGQCVFCVFRVCVCALILCFDFVL